MNINVSMDWSSALDAIKESVGPNGWLAEDVELEPYGTEWRKILRGNCRMVVRPASTEEAANAVEICHRAGIPIIPQGGNTGMVGGGNRRRWGTDHFRLQGVPGKRPPRPAGGPSGPGSGSGTTWSCRAGDC